MMRILMLNNEFPPLGGGTGTVNRALLEHFAERPELEIDLITSALGRSFEEESYASRIRIYKVPVRNRDIHHSSNRELSEYFFRGLRLALKLQRGRCHDVCFAWSAVPAGAIALALRRIAGLRYIVRVCGPDIPGFERRYRTLHVFLSPLIRRIWHGAERVVAKSAREIDLIQAVDPGLSCLLISNGVDLAVFKPRPIAPLDGPLRIICVGRLIERKGQKHLINAVKKLTDDGIDVRLDLVGTGDARAGCEALSQRLNLTDRVHFLGYVPREKIAERYNVADVFVLPSYNEGMSVALLEAMASGLAVVVTPTGGTSELVETEIHGLVFDWGDVERLTAHLRRLSQDRLLVQRMGEASRRRAEDFSWDRAVVRYLDLVKQFGITVPATGASVDAEAKHQA
jgi:glycosyltransferase involved in cell wall biosynthesis